MNNVTLIGRLTRDVDLAYTSGNNTAVAKFTLAIDRPVKKGSDKQADFIRIIAFGKTAENCDKYLCKGRLVAVNGAIQTGSYQNKEGNTVYTTDVIAGRVEFLEWGDKQSNSQEQTAMPDPAMPDSFQAVHEDVPF